MLEELKKQVCNANRELQRKGIVIYTWGNVSGIDRKSGLVVIKPSGIPYDDLEAEDMVVLQLQTGEVIEGKWKPSSDTPTHLEIYRAFPNVGGITHTHSVNAVAFAQAGKCIPALGTTHADYFFGAVPCTRPLTERETVGEYEAHTGKVIVETLQKGKIDPLFVPGILVNGHGPFTFGKDPDESVYHAVVLETVAEMALKTRLLSKDAELPDYVLKKHFERKHGPNAYYGNRA